MEIPSDHRVGSAFASEPSPLPSDDASAGDCLQNSELPGPCSSSDQTPSVVLGEGVWGQTAAAAAYAAVILLAFVVLSWTLFPAGGVAVAALGVVVSLMGLSSKYKRLSMATLALHGVLFIACCLRTI